MPLLYQLAQFLPCLLYYMCILVASLPYILFPPCLPPLVSRHQGSLLPKPIETPCGLYRPLLAWPQDSPLGPSLTSKQMSHSPYRMGLDTSKQT